jgi:hypothetical protein
LNQGAQLQKRNILECQVRNGNGKLSEVRGRESEKEQGLREVRDFAAFDGVPQVRGDESGEALGMSRMRGGTA